MPNRNTLLTSSWRGLVLALGLLAAPLVSTAAVVIGDFTGDGKTDVLWQHQSSGVRGFWPMNGTSKSGDFRTITAITNGFDIAGLGDFNSDAQTDIFWSNRLTGETGIWPMVNGTQALPFISLPTISVAWKVAGVGDFNSDGKRDVVWQNVLTGDRQIWLLNGTSYSSTAALPNVPKQWVISLVADFNGDGKPDLLWSDTETGLRGFWLMNGLNQQGAFAVLSTVPTNWVITQAGDFNGDGKTDIVWTDTTTGERGFWLLDGTVQIGDYVHLQAISTDWRLGNIGHPGLANPVIVTNPTGVTAQVGGSASFTVSATSGPGTLSYQWYKNNVAVAGATGSTLNFSSVAGADAGSYTATVTLNGLTSATSTVAVLSVPSTSTDFNLDAKSDILWQNLTTGQRGYWPMNGTAQSGTSFVSFQGTTGDWMIAGVADLDGDGMMDLLWRHDTGTVGFWLMNGSVIRGDFRILGYKPGAAWRIAGVGDFNSDGKSDIVWQNTTTGERGVWLVNGTTYDGNFHALPSTIPATTMISLVGDFNGDGKADLLWTDTLTGQRGFWLMDGLTPPSSFTALAIVPIEWVLSQTGDFNGDGKTDIVWTNTTTGQRGIWLMNGVTPASEFISLPTVSPTWTLGPAK